MSGWASPTADPMSLAGRGVPPLEGLGDSAPVYPDVRTLTATGRSDSGIAPMFVRRHGDTVRVTFANIGGSDRAVVGCDGSSSGAHAKKIVLVAGLALGTAAAAEPPQTGTTPAGDLAGPLRGGLPNVGAASAGNAAGLLGYGVKNDVLQRALLPAMPRVRRVRSRPAARRYRSMPSGVGCAPSCAIWCRSLPARPSDPDAAVLQAAPMS